MNVNSLQGDAVNILLKRVYETPHDDDGTRILVDRLWPRGMTKERAKIDVWLKEITPSHELRTWYHHDSDKWPEFKRRYFAEIDAHPEAVRELLGYAEQGTITLVYAAKAPEHNHALALKQYLEQNR